MVAYNHYQSFDAELYYCIFIIAGQDMTLRMMLLNSTKLCRMLRVCGSWMASCDGQVGCLDCHPHWNKIDAGP
jgi:hypothetical protein